MFKSKSIRILSLLLSVVLMSGLISGCGGTAEVPEAPETQTPSSGGEGADFETLSMDIFSQHRLTMVNCFATWCGPCVKEIPELDQLKKDFADRDVNVIGVVLDARSPASADDTEGILNENALSQAALIREKTGIEYSFYIPQLSLFEGRFISINAVPHTFFVNSSGEIVGDSYDGARSLEAWSEIVENQLAALD